MINLAGNFECDLIIKRELEEAKIQTVEVYRMSSEVPSSYIGVLNGFKFLRAWNYWVMKGYFDLKYASYIYDNFSKDLGIRAFGHCGNIDPRNSGLCTSKEQDKLLDDLIKTYGHMYILEHSKKLEMQLNEKTNKCKKYVTVYHIDTQHGLNAISSIIRQNKLRTKLQ